MIISKRKVMIVLLAVGLTACIGKPQMVKRSDGSKTTEGIALAETIMGKQTELCWQYHIEKEEKRMTGETVAPAPAIVPASVEKLTASGQTGYFHYQTVQLLSQQLNHSNQLMVELIGMVAEVLKPKQDPCSQLEKVMVAYYQSVGQKAAAQSATWQKAWSVAGVVGGIMATGWAVENIVAAANPGYHYGDVSVTAGQNAGGGIPTTVEPAGAVGDIDMNQVINIGGETDSKTNFASGQISGDNEKLVQAKDNQGPLTLDDANDGSNNGFGQ